MVAGRGKGETPALATSDDSLFAGALHLFQPAKGHRAGTDAVLLAAATPPEARAIADLGASTGVVGLRAAQTNPDARVMLIERDAAMLDLARQNIGRNGLDARVILHAGDAFALGKAAALREAFDCVLSNPPFFSAATIRASGNDQRAGAHVLEGSLADWVKNAVTILAPRGELVLIHRADALPELMEACGRRLGAVHLRFVHPEAEAPAIRVLVSARKGSRAPLVVLPPLVLHGPEGRFTDTAARLHAGQMRLPMRPSG